MVEEAMEEVSMEGSAVMLLDMWAETMIPSWNSFPGAVATSLPLLGSKISFSPLEKGGFLLLHPWCLLYDPGIDLAGWLFHHLISVGSGLIVPYSFNIDWFPLHPFSNKELILETLMINSLRRRQNVYPKFETWFLMENWSNEAEFHEIGLTEPMQMGLI